MGECRRNGILETGMLDEKMSETERVEVEKRNEKVIAKR